MKLHLLIQSSNLCQLIKLIVKNISIFYIFNIYTNA